MTKVQIFWAEFFYSFLWYIIGFVPSFSYYRCSCVVVIDFAARFFAFSHDMFISVLPLEIICIIVLRAAYYLIYIFFSKNILSILATMTTIVVQGVMLLTGSYFSPDHILHRPLSKRAVHPTPRQAPVLYAETHTSFRQTDLPWCIKQLGSQLGDGLD